MIPALMLLFALSAGGQSGTLALPFPSMAACEAARGEALKVIAEDTSGGKVVYVAAVCVQPVKVIVI